MEYMIMTKDLQIIMEANFILVLSISGVACSLQNSNFEMSSIIYVIVVL